MGLNTSKPVFEGVRTTKAQTSLCIRTDWSAPVLFANLKESYLNLLKANFQFLACICSGAGWFESHFVWNPEDRFSQVTAHIVL